MAFEVVRSRASDRDLALIFDHLVDGYQSVGEDEREAVERAAIRVTAIEDTWGRFRMRVKSSHKRRDSPSPLAVQQGLPSRTA